jgi:hypothetical protein
MRIGEAHDLSGVARIGEYFLIAREAGVENDFAAASRLRTRRAAVKDSPVFECQDGWAVRCIGQCLLRKCSWIGFRRHLLTFADITFASVAFALL